MDEKQEEECESNPFRAKKKMEPLLVVWQWKGGGKKKRKEKSNRPWAMIENQDLLCHHHGEIQTHLLHLSVENEAYVSSSLSRSSVWKTKQKNINLPRLKKGFAPISFIRLSRIRAALL